MSVEPTPHDEDFTAQLVRLDEDLAAGHRVVEPGEAADSVLEGRLRKGLACVKALQRLRPRRRGNPPSGAGDATTIIRDPRRPQPIESAAAVRPGTRLGRFELRRELGRGGFGVVYLAFDTRLHREIALKVPHAHALMTADLRARFQQEARASAALDHPHLVPLYEAGEVGPIAYMASAYCRGVNLAEWLRRRLAPVPFADAAALLVRLASGIAHAHERSIWHRDLKPANILLVEPDVETAAQQQLSVEARDGLPELGYYTPKIADFGLAKIVDDEDHASRSGLLIGTPAYMAPEQAQGDRKKLSERVDIHSLGVILYELLTGRPPFKGEGEVDTLLQVRFNEPLPPRALRNRIPRDLETICLRCLQKDPRQRYASAQALVDDLQRFLSGEPIHARPVSPLEHAWRYCKRKPLIVGLSIALAAAVLLGLGGVLVEANRAEVAAAQAIVERKKTEAERNRAIADRERAEQHFKRAREVITRLASAGDELLRHKGTEQRGQQILLENLEFYKSMLGDRSADPAFRLDAGRAMVRAGRMELMRGRYQEAEQLLLTARSVLDELIHGDFQRSDALHSAGVAMNNYAHCRRDQRDAATALAAYATAVTYLSEARRDPAKSLAACIELANTHVNAAALLFNLGRLADAEERALTAVSLQRENVASSKNAANPRMELALGLDLIGGIKLRQGRLAEAGPPFHEALELRLAVSAVHADDANVFRYLSRSYSNLGSYYSQKQELDEARDCLQRCIEVLDRARSLDPSSPHFLVELASAHDDLADLHKRMGRRDEEDRHRRAGIAERRKVVTHWPQLVGTRQTLAGNLADLGRKLRRSQRFLEAREVFEELVALRQDLAAREPHDRKLRRGVAEAMAAVGSINGELGEWSLAEAWHRKSVDVCAALVHQAPNEADVAAALSRCYVRVGQAMERQDRSPSLVAEPFRLAHHADPRNIDALKWLALARADAGLPARQQVEYARQWTELQPNAEVAWFHLAIAHLRAGEDTQARGPLNRAISLGKLSANDWSGYIELLAAILAPR